jgi:hypothetical protein
LVVGVLWIWKARRAKAGCAIDDTPACSTEGAGGCGCEPRMRQS